MTKKVLLIGSSFAAVPFLKRLRELSYEVHVCGMRPQEPCVTLADQYFPLDYSDPHALRNFLKENAYSAIIPDCNDVAYLTGAKLAEEFGFPGFDTVPTTLIFLEKSFFRSYLREHAISSPQSLLLEGAPQEELQKLQYPVMIKPVDSFSGRGVSKVGGADEVSAASELARQESRQGKVIIEEFIEGSLHSHSAFIRNGKIAIDFFVDEFCTVYPYQVNCSNSPSALASDLQARLRESIDRIIAHLNVVDGVFHTQFIVRGDDFYLIETTRRCPGDLYPELIMKSSGVDYIALFLAPFLGETMLATQIPRHDLWARHTISRDHDIVLGGVQNTFSSKGFIYYPIRHVGEKVVAAPFGRVGIIFIQFSDQNELFLETPRMKNYITLHEL